MNTNYVSKVRPQATNPGVQPVEIKLPEVNAALDQEIKVQKQSALDAAQINYNRESVRLAEKFGTDYKGLNNALLEIQQNTFQTWSSNGEETLGMDLLRQQDSTRLRLVDSSRKQFVDANNKKIKATSGTLLKSYQTTLSGDYSQYLDNLTKPAEERNNDALMQWQNSIDQIGQILDRTDMDGNYIFTESARTNRGDLQKYMEHGAKNYIDAMSANNDTQKLQDYYTKSILAPARYMEETGMDRETYTKVRTYAKQELERMEVKTKNLRFNQSVSEAMGLQVEFVPENLQKLKDDNLLNKEIIKSLEENNVKFSSIDPAKAETPTHMLNSLMQIQKWDIWPAQSEEEQAQVLKQGNDALNDLAEWGQKNGMTTKSQRRVREIIKNKETSKAYGSILNNFADIAANTNAVASLTGWDNMTDRERTQAGMVNDIIASGIDQINAQLDAKDFTGVMNTQKEVQKRAAQVRYMFDIPASEWQKVEKDPNHVIMLNNKSFKIKGYTFDGDIIVDDLQ